MAEKKQQENKIKKCPVEIKIPKEFRKSINMAGRANKFKKKYPND